MSAAALNLLMLNFNSQQSETGLNHRHPQNAGGPQTYPHSAASPTYPSYTHQYHQENSHHGALLTSPNGSPVRQLKRLHPGATNTATEFLRCRRRMELSSGGFGAPLYSQYPLHCRQVSSVARRNERERNRVRLVNNGFALLRQHVPSTAARSKKMSKVDTLKAAVDYIQQLRDILDDADSSVEESAAAASSSSSHSHHHHHHHPQGSLSPTSSTEGSCPDGAGSPGGYSSSSDGESSSSVSRGHHSIDDLGEEGDNKDVSELVDFASWFC